MPSYGLLGALGGLGNAMQTIGKSLEDRRQEALKRAEQLAERQRVAAEKKAEKLEDREYGFRERLALRDYDAEVTAERDDVRFQRQTERDDRLERNRDENREQTQAFQRGERLSRQDFQAAQRSLNQDFQAQLTERRAELARDNSLAGIAERHRLAQGGIRGVAYINPKDDGTAEAVYIKNDGTQVRTGKRFVRGKTASAGSSGSEWD